MEELTVSMFRVVYPREMFEELTREGHEIEERYPGIYYVTKDLPFPVQIIVTQKLSPETHSSLRILTDHAEAEDIRHFLEQAREMKRPGDRANIDALLQASVAANYDLYEDVRRDFVMCQALQELMKDEIEAKVNDAVDQAETESKVEDIRNIMSELRYSAEQAMDLLKIPQQKRSMYISKL
jgi:hypothetical protein